MGMAVCAWLDILFVPPDDCPDKAEAEEDRDRILWGEPLCLCGKPPTAADKQIDVGRDKGAVPIGIFFVLID